MAAPTTTVSIFEFYIHSFIVMNLLYLALIYLLTDLRGREEERERNIDLLFHSLTCSLVDSCTCPWGSSVQPWRLRTAL